MSLDATAVLFTPVVVQLVRAAEHDSDPSLLATTQLANASSSLLPVSNLTNLLVFSATGLTFGGFAVRMALPTLAAASVVVGTAVRSDGESTPEPRRPRRAVHLDGFARFVIVALAALMVAFFVGSALGIEPAWIAIGGRGDGRGRGDRPSAGPSDRCCSRRRRRRSSCSSSPSRWWSRPPSTTAWATPPATCSPPATACSPCWPWPALAAVLANLVNNVPATLVLLSVMPAGSTGLLLAMLLGVNVGPNLTYTGSLATLLWRRVVRAAGVEPSRGAFFRFAVVATPLALVLATVMLWLTLQVTG